MLTEHKQKILVACNKNGVITEEVVLFSDEEDVNAQELIGELEKDGLLVGNWYGPLTAIPKMQWRLTHKGTELLINAKLTGLLHAVWESP